MEQFDYKPNSFKYKEEQKKVSEETKPVEVQKVIQGPVTVQKKKGVKKIFRMILAEDLPKVKEYVLQDVLVPSIKKAISDIVTNGSDILIYGNTKRDKNSNPFSSRVSYKDYSSYSKPINNTMRTNTIERTGFDFDEFVFNTRGDAEMVLTQMEDVLSRYGIVRVTNFYESIGEKNNNYQLHNYGWTNLASAKVVRVPNGYIIQLPNPYPID